LASTSGSQRLKFSTPIRKGGIEHGAACTPTSRDQGDGRVLTSTPATIAIPLVQSKHGGGQRLGGHKNGNWNMNSLQAAIQHIDDGLTIMAASRLSMILASSLWDYLMDRMMECCGGKPGVLRL
jgi:hypothetical protein